MLIISSTAQISKFADIEDSVRGTQIVIEDGVVIDSFVKIKPVGGEGDVRIGAHSYINAGCVIYSGNGVRIGQHVLVAANCTFAAVNHEYHSKDKLICEQRFRPSKGGIVVEDDVWIGAGVVLLDGAIVRRGAVIGANCVVRGELKAYGVYVGNPPVLKGERK
jgi:acetyltransferase-like isoleucine patch superfamily enzyme